MAASTDSTQPTDVEDKLAERGIDVSFQTVSKWALKFGLKFTHQLRRRSRGNFADKSRIDERVVSVKGSRHELTGGSRQKRGA